MNRLVATACVDPYRNLALEEHLFDTQGAGATLYLWQNRNTVVIGRNQNAWKECRVQLLENEGGKIARRSSGGGAVYHDMGNLNFTFVLPREDYDLARQFAVIQKAVASFGVETAVSGRNDLVLASNGAKFSGNAFRFTEHTAMHHGTLLISADMERLSRYLAPSKKKLAAKGVESVRSRVCNLSDLAPDITVRSMVRALQEAFIEVYGAARTVDETQLDTPAVEALEKRYASWDWRFGKTPQFTVGCSERFDWGEIELLLDVRAGHVESCTVFTDAMDETLADRLTEALQGAPYTAEAMQQRIVSVPNADRAQLMELANWMAGQLA